MSTKAFDTHILQPFDSWKGDLKKQNLDKLNNIEPDESEVLDEPLSP